MPNWLTELLGFAPKAEAAIKADIAGIKARADSIENTLSDPSIFTQGFIQPSVTNPAVTSSIVGNTVSNLVKIAGTFGASIDDLVAKIDIFEEELRQKRAARGAAVNALSSLADDKALTDDEKTAISLEQNDHAEDLVAAATRLLPTPEIEPTAPAAPAPGGFAPGPSQNMPEGGSAV